MTADRPIRVLRIIARLNIGGPAIHVTLLTEKLAQPDYGYECALVAGAIGADEGDMAYYAHARGVEPIFMPELGRAVHPVRDLVTTWKLFRLIRQFKPDVVHTHTAKAGFVGRLAARLAGVPVIVHTVHGHVFEGYFGWTKKQLFLNLERLAARCGHQVLTLTDGLKRDLVEKYRIAPADKITVLPLGLDLRPFYDMPRGCGHFRAAHNIPLDVPLVAIVGRMVPVKNHALFLQAAAQVHTARPDVRFAIVGDGELRAEIEAQVDALGLRESTCFTGWVKELAPLYSDVDLVVNSSLNEGTPVSLIEAMAVGCPVVATAVGGAPDLLENGNIGKLIQSGNADDLAQAILETLANPPDTRPVKDLILARFGVDRLVHDVDMLYRALWMAKKPT